LRVARRKFGGAVEIRVRDSGTGIPPEMRDKLFQPFVTTKPTGEGSASRSAGTSSPSRIVARSRSIAPRGEFTEFTIRLPGTHRLGACPRNVNNFYNQINDLLYPPEEQ
jgi:signal transduction histidine kinase